MVRKNESSVAVVNGDLRIRATRHRDPGPPVDHRLLRGRRPDRPFLSGRAAVAELRRTTETDRGASPMPGAVHGEDSYQCQSFSPAHPIIPAPTKARPLREQLGDELLDREVCDFMTPGCVSISEDASVAEAAKALAVHRVHAVLVVGAANGTPLGWVTARGLLGWLGRDRSPPQRTRRDHRAGDGDPPHGQRAVGRSTRSRRRHDPAARPQQAPPVRPRASSPTSTSPWRRGVDQARQGGLHVPQDHRWIRRPARIKGRARARQAIAEATGAELDRGRRLPVDPLGAAPTRLPRGRVEFAAAVERAAESVDAGGRGLSRAARAARGLHELAEETSADLVVVGSGSAGKVGQVFAGNVALSLLHGSPCAVAVAPKGYRRARQRQAISEDHRRIRRLARVARGAHDGSSSRAARRIAEGRLRCRRAAGDRLRQGARTRAGAS